MAQGAKSVEVRPVGISKGLAMSRIINAIVAREALEAVQYDFVLVAGHFLVRDENIFTFFEGQSLKVRPLLADTSLTASPDHVVILDPFLWLLCLAWPSTSLPTGIAVKYCGCLRPRRFCSPKYHLY